MKEHGCVPIKLYSQTQVVGQTWPVDQLAGPCSRSIRNLTRFSPPLLDSPVLLPHSPGHQPVLPGLLEWPPHWSPQAPPGFMAVRPQGRASGSQRSVSTTPYDGRASFYRRLVRLLSPTGRLGQLPVVSSWQCTAVLRNPNYVFPQSPLFIITNR